MGAEIDANGTADALYVTAGGLGSGVPKIVEVMADVVRNASYPAAEVELAKGNAIQGLAARESTPEFLAQKALARAVYGDHPYHIMAPTKETLQAATAAQLKQEHARRFHPDRALLVVVGDFDAGRRAGRRHPVLRHLARHRRRARRDPAISRGGDRAPTPRRPAGRLRPVADPDGPPRRHRHRPRTTTRCWWPTPSAPAPSAAAWSRTSARTRATRYSPGGGSRRPGQGRPAHRPRRRPHRGHRGRSHRDVLRAGPHGRDLAHRGGAVAGEALPGRALPAPQPDPGLGGPDPGLELGQRPASRSPRRVRLQGERRHRRPGPRGGPSLLPVGARQTVVVVGDEAKVKAELAQFGEVDAWSSPEPRSGAGESSRLAGGEPYFRPSASIRSAWLR